MLEILQSEFFQVRLCGGICRSMRGREVKESVFSTCIVPELKLTLPGSSDPTPYTHDAGVVSLLLLDYCELLRL